MAISCKRLDKKNAAVLLIDHPTDFLSPVAILARSNSRTTRLASIAR